ncbi:response regulator [Chloroflexales bacterium ZM16-3]|nr:response regulator [Chloroflexales bacterium ZM16-3]
MAHTPHSHSDDSASPEDSRPATETQIAQAQLAGMLSLMSHAVIGTDPQQRVALVNPEAARLFGYSREELLGLPLAVLLPSLVAAAGARTPVGRRHITTGVRKGGATFAATADIARIEVADGAVCTIQIREPYPLSAPLGGDIEQALRETEAALQDTERKLGILFDLLPVGISILNAERNLVYANPALDQILHMDRSNLFHQIYQQRQYLRPDGTPLAFEEFASAQAFRAHQPVTDVETGIVTETGEVIWTSVSAAPVDFPDWRVVVVTTDITARKRAEQALAAERTLLAKRVAERTADLSLANAELARAARLKDEFLASMSHELRTPLTGILGRAEALQEGIYGPVTAEQVTSLHSVAESGQHLLTLINDILDLSKIESGRLTLEYTTLDIDLLGTMSMRMVAQIAQFKRITLSSSFDGQAQRVYADERRLKQILVNLLANAVKFTPEGGKVGLEVQGNPEQQTVTFTIWDTGVGIAAEDLPKLFQPFVQIDSRLNRQYTGTGLGLALVARLAQAHGGSVAVESTPGQGSRFSVTLPWSPSIPPTAPVSATAAVDTTRPAVRQALVIEDSPTVAAQITRYLRELGARVEIHPHGTGTVERAIALQPDVIVLDILLPDDDGWTVLRQLKAEPRTHDIPVLVVSVVDAPEQARALGAAAMLVKPIDRPTLEQALRQVLVRPDTPPMPTALVVAPHLERPRILLADDNEETLETLGDYLRAKGYDLRVARNGCEAIVQAQEELPDVILMDIQMPGMDGLEAIRRIRAEADLAHVPILAVTALAMPADRERCLAAGADAYLPKPINLRTLMATIEAHRQWRGDLGST